MPQNAPTLSACGDQIGCKVINERNGDVVIIADDVDGDGDGKGGGVIRCPVNSGTCSPLRKRPPQSEKAHRNDARYGGERALTLKGESTLIGV